MVGIVRVQCERCYTPPSERERVGDYRQFDIPKEDTDVIERIVSDMKKAGWSVTETEL